MIQHNYFLFLNINNNLCSSSSHRFKCGSTSIISVKESLKHRDQDCPGITKRRREDVSAYLRLYSVLIVSDDTLLIYLNSFIHIIKYFLGVFDNRRTSFLIIQECSEIHM